MNEAAPKKRWRWLGILATVIACATILVSTAYAIIFINRTQPTAKQTKATRKSSALVKTVVIKRGTFSPTLSVLGTVQAAQDITLSPRVSGQITEVSKTFEPGGVVRKDEVLLRVDPADFENNLFIRESELEQAQASLKIEEGRQSLAKKELQLLESTIDETNRELVLRAPQIASIRAEVSAAKAAVDRAKLDLDRSTITAPFDAQIISQSVNIGSQVSPGDELARLVGTNEYWISAALPVKSLQWVDFPDGNEPGSSVTLRNSDAWPTGSSREGTVTRMVGTVDERTRLARILIRVQDPLGKSTDNPPLILQSLLEVEIAGRPIEDVVRLRREFVRDEDTVWVMKDDKLEIRPCEVMFRDAKFAFISNGLETGDEVVISTLATVADGVGLRRINPSDAESSDPSNEAQAVAE